jgi:hypothetical protein
LGLGKTFHQENGAWNAENNFNTSGAHRKPYFPYQSNQCPTGSEGGGQCAVSDERKWDFQLRLKIIEYLRYAANVTPTYQSNFLDDGTETMQTSYMIVWGTIHRLWIGGKTVTYLSLAVMFPTTERETGVLFSVCA